MAPSTHKLVNYDGSVLVKSSTELEKKLRDANLGPARDVSINPELDFRGVNYPQLPHGKNQIKYITQNAPYFPAVDLIIHVGKVVIAFHCHAADREEQSYKDCIFSFSNTVLSSNTGLGPSAAPEA